MKQSLSKFNKLDIIDEICLCKSKLKTGFFRDEQPRRKERKKGKHYQKIKKSCYLIQNNRH